MAATVSIFLCSLQHDSPDFHPVVRRRDDVFHVITSTLSPAKPFLSMQWLNNGPNVKWSGRVLYTGATRQLVLPKERPEPCFWMAMSHPSVAQPTICIAIEQSR